MLFNLFEFLLFFPIVTALYFLLPQAWRWSFLLSASCLFYMAFIPKYILILFATFIVDYAAGILMEKTPSRDVKRWYLASSEPHCVAILGSEHVRIRLHRDFDEAPNPACIGAESLPSMCDERLMRGADAAASLTTKLGRTRQEDIGSSSRLRSKLMAVKAPGILVE